MLEEEVKMSRKQGEWCMIRLNGGGSRENAWVGSLSVAKHTT